MNLTNALSIAIAQPQRRSKRWRIGLVAALAALLGWLATD